MDDAIKGIISEEEYLFTLPHACEAIREFYDSHPTLKTSPSIIKTTMDYLENFIRVTVTHLDNMVAEINPSLKNWRELLHYEVAKHLQKKDFVCVVRMTTEKLKEICPPVGKDENSEESVYISLLILACTVAQITLMIRHQFDPQLLFTRKERLLITCVMIDGTQEEEQRPFRQKDRGYC